MYNYCSVTGFLCLTNDEIDIQALIYSELHECKLNRTWILTSYIICCTNLALSFHLSSNYFCQIRNMGDLKNKWKYVPNGQLHPIGLVEGLGLMGVEGAKEVDGLRLKMTKMEYIGL